MLTITHHHALDLSERIVLPHRHAFQVAAKSNEAIFEMADGQDV